MKLLVDNAISPIVSDGLKKEGFDAIHVREIGMQSASDYEIFQVAIQEERIIISADTDFGALLAIYKKTKPSFLLLRKGKYTKPMQILLLLLDILPKLEDELEKGTVITVTEKKIRIRYLPIG